MQGEIILENLVELSGKLSVRIAVNTPQGSQPLNDLKLLNQSGDSLTERAYTGVVQCSMVVFLTTRCYMLKKRDLRDTIRETVVTFCFAELWEL